MSDLERLSSLGTNPEIRDEVRALRLQRASTEELQKYVNDVLEQVEQILFGRSQGLYRFSLMLLGSHLKERGTAHITTLRPILLPMLDHLLRLVQADKSDIYLTCALEVADFIDQTARVTAVMKNLLAQGIVISPILYPTVVQILAKKYPEETTLITQNCLHHTTAGMLSGIYDAIPDMKTRIEHLELNIQLYCQRKKVPYNCKNVQQWPAIVTMAGEIVRDKKYRVVIGITKSGSPLAIAIKLLGGRVGFIDAHKQDNLPASWVAQYERHLPVMSSVLICEDDIVGGETLKKVAPLLRGTFPDIAIYNSIYPGFSRESLQKNLKDEGYMEIITPGHFSATKFLEDLDNIEQSLKKTR